MTRISAQSFYYSTPLVMREGANNDYQFLGTPPALRESQRRDLHSLLTRLSLKAGAQSAHFSLPLDDNAFAIGRIENGGEDARGRPGRVVMQGAVLDRGEYVDAIKGALFAVFDALPTRDVRAESPDGFDQIDLGAGFDPWAARISGLADLSEQELRSAISVIAELVGQRHAHIPSERVLRATLALSRPDASWPLALSINAELKPAAEGSSGAGALPSFDLLLDPNASISPSLVPEKLPATTRVWELVAALRGVGNPEDFADFLLLMQDDFAAHLQLSLQAKQPRVRDAMADAVRTELAGFERFEGSALQAWADACASAERGSLSEDGERFMRETTPQMLAYCARFANQALGWFAERFADLGKQPTRRSRRKAQAWLLAFILWTIAMLIAGSQLS